MVPLRRLLLLLIAALAAEPQPGQAGDAVPTPLCRREEVLRIVARTVRLWNIYNRLDETRISEFPTGEANLVNCSAYIRSVAYEASASGNPVPRNVLRPLFYEVRILRDRVHVHVLPGEAMP